MVIVEVHHWPFFFFQAEDGIRDYKVTGVQTCALPILSLMGLALAYHDRSDGGLLVTLLEMAFAGGTGIEVGVTGDPLPALFSEELGAVLQVRRADLGAVRAVLARHRLEGTLVAQPRLDGRVV